MSRWLPRIASRPSCRRASGAAPRPWHPGVTVVIPERDAPRDACRALRVARRRAGRDRRTAAGDRRRQRRAARRCIAWLRRAFPAVEWVIRRRAARLRRRDRARSRARTLRWHVPHEQRHDARRRRAIAELLPSRAPDVFALASQIFQHERRPAAARKRDSPTGTSNRSGRASVSRAGARVAGAAGRICAQAAAPRCSARRRCARYVRASRCYDPFYWEDVEWSVRAWRDGMRVLFCPRSHAAHQHRMTTARFYSER